ncbi:MAG: glycoside hydrolase family 13 protein, partial [Chloroflexi bacterium]|nr:glycoside hydrolase family 13 protein [Chloroflexota bacterium]
MTDPHPGDRKDQRTPLGPTAGDGSTLFEAPPAWVRDAVFYQVFPDRFAASARLPKPGPLEPWDAPPTFHGFKGGDLLGLAERLDDLADLGITAPIFTSASNHRYHTYDYLAIDPLLGGNAAFRELVEAAHGRGMRLVLDGVFNHVGRGFWPFHHVLEAGADSPYRDWFHLSPEVLSRERGLRPYPEWTPSWDEVAADPGPFVSGDWSLQQFGYRAWWGLPALPKLNTDHPPVREHIFAVAEHWLREGADGWRLDVPQEIADPSFWAEFRRRCRAIRPDAYLVGEIWHVEPGWVGGGGGPFDGLMNYPLMEAITSFVAGPSLDTGLVGGHHQLSHHVAPTDAAGFAGWLQWLLAAYPAATNAAMLNLLSSHDMPRIRSLCGGDAAAVRLAYLLLATLPGAPCIYYGDEVGLEGGGDPDCRRGYPARPEDRDEALRAWLRAALAIRSANSALRGDGTRVAAAEGGLLVLVRGGGVDPTARGAPAVVAVNAANDPAEIRVSLPELAGRHLAR